MAKSKEFASWGAVGFAGKHVDRAKVETSSNVNRFWLPKGETRKILFLDDEPFCIYEHRLKIDGSWKGNEYTCRDMMTPGCPMCASKVQRTYVGFLTILDLTGFKDDEGNTHKNLRRLFPMGISTLDMFHAFKKKRDGLTGWIVEVMRTDGKRSVSIGDHFDFLEQVDPFEDKRFFFTSRLEGGKKKPPEPFEYNKIFKPLSADDLMLVTGKVKGEKFKDTLSNDGDDEGGDEDEVY